MFTEQKLESDNAKIRPTTAIYSLFNLLPVIKAAIQLNPILV